MSKINTGILSSEESSRQIEYRRMIPVFATLTAYRVTYDNGDVCIQNASADTTLKDAIDWWVGQRFEITEDTFRTVVSVEQVIGPSN